MMAESERLAREVREVRRWMHESKVRKKGERARRDDEVKGRSRTVTDSPGQQRKPGACPCRGSARMVIDSTVTTTA
jgi:hypothetical protein